MTASDPLPWLDQLDALRAAASPGPWSNEAPFTKVIDGAGSSDFMAIVQCDSTHDAALIVEAVNSLPALTAAVRAVLAKHVPWYELDGARHDNTVNVGCEQYDGCDGNEDRWCASSAGDGHEVLACSECRCVVDFDIDGFLLWPCPTVTAVTTAIGGGALIESLPAWERDLIAADFDPVAYAATHLPDQAIGGVSE